MISYIQVAIDDRLGSDNDFSPLHLVRFNQWVIRHWWEMKFKIMLYTSALTYISLRARGHSWFRVTWAAFIPVGLTTHLVNLQTLCWEMTNYNRVWGRLPAVRGSWVGGRQRTPVQVSAFLTPQRGEPPPRERIQGRAGRVRATPVLLQTSDQSSLQGGPPVRFPAAVIWGCASFSC